MESFCKSLLHEWKTCFVYIQNLMPFMHIVGVAVAEKCKIWPSPTYALGSLVRVGRFKASVYC